MNCQTKKCYVTRSGRTAQRLVLIAKADESDFDEEQSSNSEEEIAQDSDSDVSSDSFDGSSNNSDSVKDDQALLQPAIIKTGEQYTWSKRHILYDNSFNHEGVYLVACATEAQYPLDFFHIFFNKSMIEHLAVETNRYSVEKCGKSINCSVKEMEKFI